MERGAWWTTVHGVAKSQTRLSRLTLSLHFLRLEKAQADRLTSILSVYQQRFIEHLVAELVKNPPGMRETWILSRGWEGSLEEGMTTHSSIIAQRIPVDREAWLQSMRTQRVGHNWAIKHRTQCTNKSTLGTASGSKSICTSFFYTKRIKICIKLFYCKLHSIAFK